MCELCDEADDGVVCCQDCGRMICFDNEPNNVDVVDQAYVTASGDLFCRRCGIQYDIGEEEDGDYEDDYFPYPDFEQVSVSGDDWDED